jgi:metal-dependent amidase/aminoacylase/carboxypeptidase family protein
MMAAFDIFDIEIKGRGAHAAMPHLAVDPIAPARKS